MGLSLVFMAGHHIHDEENEYCEVSFCYCEVKDNQKICVCHHPELHNQQNTSDDVELHIPKNTSGDQNFCYYTKPHSNHDSDLALIVVDKERLILSIIRDTEIIIDGFGQQRFIPSALIFESIASK